MMFLSSHIMGVKAKIEIGATTWNSRVGGTSNVVGSSRFW
jgi:hypothetical protein